MWNGKRNDTETLLECISYGLNPDLRHQDPAFVATDHITLRNAQFSKLKINTHVSICLTHVLAHKSVE